MTGGLEIKLWRFNFGKISGWHQILVIFEPLATPAAAQPGHPYLAILLTNIMSINDIKRRVQLRGVLCFLRAHSPLLYYSKAKLTALTPHFGSTWCPCLLAQPHQTYFSLIYGTVFDEKCAKIHARCYRGENPGAYFCQNVLLKLKNCMNAPTLGPPCVHIF